MDWQRKKVLVVGFGRSGRAAARLLLRRGARVAVTDRDTSIDTGEFSSSPIDWFLGKPEASVFESADAIVVSPGIPWNLPELKGAREKGITVLSELELSLPVTGPKIIAVTGTNGKTTTVSLIDHLLKTAGLRSLSAGNIGTPLCDCLDTIGNLDFLVLELSSYQLESTPSLKPDVAVWLNVTEDHLEWHETFEAYVAAKAKLIRQTGLGGRVIYNREDETVRLAVEQIPAQRWEFSSKRQVPLGGWVEEGCLHLKTGFKNPPQIFPLEGVPLIGIHNWENMLASLLAVSSFVSDAAVLLKGLRSFTPLPHRMQKVTEKNGVIFINDSKGTNVGATLKGLIGTRGRVIWIAGGKDKGGDYAPLVATVKRKVRRAIFIGEAKEKMLAAFGKATEVTLAATLEEAVRLAAAGAVTGETVLFSPACASFDMFRDYTHRGDSFMDIVRNVV